MHLNSIVFRLESILHRKEDAAGACSRSGPCTCLATDQVAESRDSMHSFPAHGIKVKAGQKQVILTFSIA